eukprot:TRINITY_DN908_c0_g2_i1.p1 TRINITY_DN908_c0_g2~~TRINITY_DN908_c0_g2_i1.p1  ORF type:complete len:712 (-),score=230.38 TRINITY_DN908_c0_g2_i1:619-2754(-)
MGRSQPLVFLLLFFFFSLSICAEEKATESDDSSPSETEESTPLLSTLDYVLLLVVLAVGYWYFFREEPSVSVGGSGSFKFDIIPEGGGPSQESTSFLSKMKNKRRRLVVFYGSQTGTAEEFAGRLANEGIRYGLKGVVADPEETDMEDLTKLREVSEVLDGTPTLAVFCLATYGEGDPTDNAQEFFEWLQAGNDVDLSTMTFAVFALGNKTYEHFNAMGIYVDKRLDELGARRIHKIGLGDDDDNIENDFVTWKEEFWSSVCSEFEIEASEADFSLRQYSAKVLEEPDSKKIYVGEPARLRSFQTQRPPFDQKNPYLSEIKVNRNLHSESSDRYCMHIELNIKESRIRYEAGDHVAIFPRNDPKVVEAIGKALDIDLDTVFTMSPLEDDAIKKQPFPCPTTYRTALSYYVDIMAFPRTHVLKEISDYASDPEEKAKILKMVSREGKDIYQSYIIDSCRHIAHILEDFPSLKINIHHLMELLPRLQPRYYSISSSPRVSPDRIHITAVVVWYKTLTGRINNGVCTTWLKPMVPEDDHEHKVPIFVRRSQFRLPNRHNVPVIMVGPGTGLAPFRGFIQERSWHKAQGKPVGETHLFFGCRNEAVDYIYREELEEHLASGGLSRLHLAFSRDIPGKKVYVTTLMKENASDLWRLIGSEGAHVYVCGDAKNMAKDVHNVILKDVLMDQGKLSESEAEAYLKQMESKKRYSADVWS